MGISVANSKMTTNICFQVFLVNLLTGFLYGQYPYAHLTPFLHILFREMAFVIVGPTVY